jgi:hypothetical protein
MLESNHTSAPTVFYDNRTAYSKKWMAISYVKKRGCQKKVLKSLGRFDTMIEAAVASAKARGKKVTEIRKKKAAIYKTRVGKDLAEGRFKVLARIFVNRYVGKKRKKLVPANPPDYENSEKLMKTPSQQKMFREEAAMEEASVGLKYGPPRDELLPAWRTTRHSVKYWKALAVKLGFGKGETEKAARKLRIIKTLQIIAKKLHRKDLKFWVENAGRFVSKHLGPVMFLKKLGVVRKTKKKAVHQRKKND